MSAAVIVSVLALFSLVLWCVEFRQRAEEGSAFQLIQRAPRVARLSPRGRQVAAHLGIAAPTAVLVLWAVALFM